MLSRDCAQALTPSAEPTSSASCRRDSPPTAQGKPRSRTYVHWSGEEDAQLRQLCQAGARMKVLRARFPQRTAAAIYTRLHKLDIRPTWRRAWTCAERRRLGTLARSGASFQAIQAAFPERTRGALASQMWLGKLRRRPRWTPEETARLKWFLRRGARPAQLREYFANRTMVALKRKTFRLGFGVG